MHESGRTLIGPGLLIALIGVVVTLWGRFRLPRLPGDFVVQHDGTTFFFPLASSIIISIVLTVLLNLLRRKP